MVIEIIRNAILIPAMLALVSGLVIRSAKAEPWIYALISFVLFLLLEGRGQLFNALLSMDYLWIGPLLAAALFSNEKAAGIVSRIILAGTLLTLMIWPFRDQVTMPQHLASVAVVVLPVVLIKTAVGPATTSGRLYRLSMASIIAMPVLMLASMVAIDGSLKIAEYAGAIGITALVLFALQVGRNQSVIASGIILPTQLAMLAAIHLAEFSPAVMLLLLIPWLVLHLNRWIMPAFLIIGSGYAVIILVLASGMYFIWPEQALY